MARANQRPLIAITASRRRNIPLILANRLAVWRAGGRGLVVTPAHKRRRAMRFDGLVVGGGDDIDVRLYDHDLKLTTRTDKERDDLELELLAIADAGSLPILGICRGAQMINVYRGGDLHHDIYQSFEGLPRVRTFLPRKEIEIEAGSFVATLLGRTNTRVNALHHQSIDRLGHDLRISARDRYGIVQAIEDPARPYVVGVQWHPELLLGRGRQQRFFSRLVEEANGASALN